MLTRRPPQTLSFRPPGAPRALAFATAALLLLVPLALVVALSSLPGSMPAELWTVVLALVLPAALLFALGLWLGRPWARLSADTVALRQRRGSGWISIPLGEIDGVARREEVASRWALRMRLTGYALLLRSGDPVVIGSDYEGLDARGRRIAKPYRAALAESVADRIGEPILTVSGAEGGRPYGRDPASWQNAVLIEAAPVPPKPPPRRRAALLVLIGVLILVVAGIEWVAVLRW